MRGGRLGVITRMYAVIALLWFFMASAAAQVPVPAPPSPEVAEIAVCLCLERAVGALGASMADRQRAYDASRQEVADLDSQLQNARMSINVNNPAAVAQFRQMLERRDDVLRRSSGVLFNQYQETVALYNQRVNEYNARCADRPRNPILLNQVQATLVCPPVP